MTDAEVRWGFLRPDELTARIEKAPVAYLPLGTLEWHGWHLPLGSDYLQPEGIFRQLARTAGGVLLPPLFMGPDIHEFHDGRHFYGMDILGFPEGEARRLPGSAYRIETALFDSMMMSLMRLLHRAGIRILMAHGHGPSTHRLREKRTEWESATGLLLLELWGADGPDIDGYMTDHAAANETSIMMHLQPELVRMDRLSSDADTPPTAISGDDPRQFASATQGRRILEKSIEKASRTIEELLRRTGEETT